MFYRQFITERKREKREREGERERFFNIDKQCGFLWGQLIPLRISNPSQHLSVKYEIITIWLWLQGGSACDR